MRYILTVLQTTAKYQTKLKFELYAVRHIFVYTFCISSMVSQSQKFKIVLKPNSHSRFISL